MAPKRRLKLRQSAVQHKAQNRNDQGAVRGGIARKIGYTADLGELETIGKGVFGLTIEHDTPVLEMDIMADASVQPVITPVLPYKELLQLYLQSTILRQCVEAYRVNIEGYGAALEYIGPEGQIDSLAARNEKTRLERVIGNLTSDGRPLQKHREDSRDDCEVLGARCFEIAEDLIGRVVMFNHVPVHTVRMTKRDKVYTEVEMVNPLTGTMYKTQRRFRRFLQQTDEGERIWFKEYGDPRSIDPKTGKENPNLDIEDQATAIYYEGLYVPGTPYGIPRWAGCIPALMGSREAEMVNVNFFRDNAIPALAVLVSGGALTADSFDKIEQYIAGVRGQRSMNRIVVLEAQSDGNDMLSADGSAPAPKVDIKPMLSERQHEGLFANYIKAADEKVLSSMRLPPVYVGLAKEYNRASAFASMQVADLQIFTPERSGWDEMFDRIVLSTHNPKYWRYRSLGPALSDPQEVAKIVTTLSKEGGMTPNVAIKLANRFLDADIEVITEDWGNTPFEVIMQMIKAGNTIKGLESFISKAAEVTKPPVATNDNEDAADAVVASIRNSVSTMFDELSEQLTGEVPALFQRAIIDYTAQNKAS